MNDIAKMCAWCGLNLSGRTISKGEVVTHGICADCEWAERAKVTRGDRIRAGEVGTYGEAYLDNGRMVWQMKQRLRGIVEVA